MDFISKIGALLADIVVPTMIIVSNLFFHGWAVFIAICVTMFLLNILIKPSLNDNCGSIGFFEDFKEDFGYRFFFRTFLFTLLISYISLAFLVFFNIQVVDDYLKDDNVPGVFLSNEVFTFIGSITPLIGLYFLFTYGRYRIVYGNWDFKYYLGNIFLESRSFNSYTVGYFFIPIISFIAYIIFKIWPNTMLFLWPWVKSYV